jgi:hypothetical protein
MTRPPSLDYTFTCHAAPVQAEGTLDDHPFYFRARGDHWTFSLAEEPGLDPIYIDSPESAAGRGYFLTEQYGEAGSFAASYLELAKARDLIADCARRYRTRSEPDAVESEDPAPGGPAI